MEKSKVAIIIVANKYPNKYEPNVNVFTQQIVWSFADLGYDCTVICPMPINYNKSNISFPSERTEFSDRGSQIKIYHPKYVGAGQNGIFRKIKVRITTRLYTNAVDSVLKKICTDNSVLFAEFLCPAGVAVSHLGRKYDIPAYMQIGEATYQGNEKYGNKKLRDKLLIGLTGIIALSGQNRDYLVNAGIIEKEKIIILPSGYRKDRFYKIDKKAARMELGLPLDKFIVGFCGSFDDRKGILRLDAAIDKIDDDEVCLVAVGKGNIEPKSSKCVFKGIINHDRLMFFYNAIDVFAFPTYHEGCCTAIVEAIACGCPIISSDRPFNYEICDKKNSILIEPDDIDAMKENILKLKNNKELAAKLSEGSLNKAKSLTLDEKAINVLKYMKVLD